MRRATKAAVSCPCCQFLPEDLFLPQGQEASLDSSPVEGSSSTETPEQASSTSTTTFLVPPPLEAFESIRRHFDTDHTILVDTHGHAHLGREETNDTTSSSVYRVLNIGEEETTTSLIVASLTCAVHPEDWSACLEYASQSANRIPALGVHPWYLENLPEDWLGRLEDLLLEHPGCLIGEIGLCKQARFLRTYEGGKKEALEIQRSVFVKQLQLAGKLQRSVTVHCVNQQGLLNQILKENEGQLPPIIALHSFTGTAHQVQQLLKWEASLKLSHPLLYFGFSHIINYAMCSSDKSRRQGCLAIQSVPHDRLLAESDVHCDADVVGGTAGAVAYIAMALNEPIEAVAELTRRNGLRMLCSGRVE